jgi:putative acyl-CoA dehydrogenase
MLRGHKWFFSAPMCDAHLVVARMATASGELGGHACFVPRWRPDGSKNPVRVQRLKDKVGNRSNSSSEVELQDAWAFSWARKAEAFHHHRNGQLHAAELRAGQRGRLRSATVQSIAYARQRSAFWQTSRGSAADGHRARGPGTRKRSLHAARHASGSGL